MAPLLNLVTVTVDEAQPPVARVAAGVARKGHGVAFSVISPGAHGLARKEALVRPHVHKRNRWEIRPSSAQTCAFTQSTNLRVHTETAAEAET